jgi:hypothetical protein
MHKNVKRSIEDYDKGLCLAVVDYTVKADDKVASYRLFMVKKKDALPIEPVVDRYVALFYESFS